MIDLTLTGLLVLPEDNFFEKYRALRHVRFLSADSVSDFIRNKHSLATPLSDLVLFSHLEKKDVIFYDVKVEKEDDTIYDFSEEDPGHYAKLYKIYDGTGEVLSFWPTKDSKFAAKTSCDRFEEIKNFRSNLIGRLSMLYHIKSKIGMIYSISFYTPKKKQKTRIFQFAPEFTKA